jgi:hypothetical protein
LLVIDPDTRFLDQLRTDSTYGEVQPVLASSAAQAEVVLADPSARFRAVFVCADVVAPTVIPMIRKIHAEHPATPIFLLYRGAAPVAHREAARLAVHGVINKGTVESPIGLGDLVKQIHPSGRLPALIAPKKARKPMPAEPQASASESAEDREFVPVRAEEFLNGLPSFYDVHIRVPSGRYLKILNAKEAIEPERVLNFIELGVKNLFIAKASHARCLSYCDLLGQALLRQRTVSPEMKMMRIIDVGTDFFRELQALGMPEGDPAFRLDDDHLEYAQGFLGELHELIRGVGKHPEEIVGAFLKNAQALEHGVGVAVASSIMALPLQIGNEKVFAQLGLAAILHDIGLMKLPEHLRAEDEMAMSASDLVLYQRHPELGAEILSQLPQIPSIAVQAVSMHHERRNNRGFPGRVSGGEIPLFAQVVGICDELVKLLRRKRTEPKLDVYRVMELKVFPGFSPGVTQAFRDIFAEKLSQASGDGAGAGGSVA